MNLSVSTLRLLDSHTAGEPTRLVLSGGPELGSGPLADRVRLFGAKFDHYRSAVVNEPRGSDAMVGALLVQPHAPGCHFGVIFFNNVGYLGMCGHGTIGLVSSLAHLGQLVPGKYRIDTPVGVVEAEFHANGDVSVGNVASRREEKDVVINVPGIGPICGDVAWGGNHFFLVSEHRQRLDFSEIGRLCAFTTAIREAVNVQGYPQVDHVELFGAARSPSANSRNFVLCPGGAYDRSPCGTGTSAKLACLAADGKLAEEEVWVQESVIGSHLTGRYRWLDRAKGEIAPTITGRAFVTAEALLHVHPEDPFGWGIDPVDPDRRAAAS